MSRRNRNRPPRQIEEILKNRANPGPTAPDLLLPAGPTNEETDKSAKAELDALVGDTESLRGSRVLIYWISELGRISSSATRSFYDQLEAIGKTRKLDLILYSTGGDVDVPIRLVTLMREYCEVLGILLPHRAHSAATLLALGGDEIVMTPLSVLGPIDPSRSHPLLPRREGAAESEPISVQDMRHAMEFIRNAAGQGKEMPYTPEAMAQIFTALFDKIHPLAIGAIEQSYSLAKLVGKKCLATHMDPTKEEAKINEIVDKLCDEYKSHSYEIGRREARTLGLKVTDAESNLHAALVRLLRFYVSRPIFPKPLPSKGKSFKGQIAWLESTALHFRVEATYRVEDEGSYKVLGDQWVAY